MQDPKSLMLCWCSMFRGSSDIVCSIFAQSWGQYCNYWLMPVHCPVIIQKGSPKIIEDHMTLMSMMGLWKCRFPFYLFGRPMLSLWKLVTVQPFDYQRGKTNNCWQSIDTHLKDILTVIGCLTVVCKIHTALIDSQGIVMIYNHLNPNTSWFLSFWTTTIHVTGVTNNVGPSRFSAFGW